MLAQTRAADEIIIFDDASTDDSVAVIERLAAGRPTVRLVRLAERAGVIANLNRGLAEAKGDLIAFPGADDFIFPDFLETAAGLLERYPEAGLAAASAEIWDGGDIVTGIRPAILPAVRPGYFGAGRYRALLAGADNFFLGATTLYRRSALLETGGFDGNLGSMTDGMAARRIAARHGFCFEPRALGMWRIHGANYSVSMASSDEGLASMTARFTEILDKEPPGLFPPGYAEMLERRMRFGVGRLIVLGADLSSSGTLARLCRLTGNTAADRAAFAVAARAGALGRPAALAWLTLRLRPFSLLRLSVEPIRRRLAASLPQDGQG
jgi:glycosyltransferase involved in cell wall biosynthesis